MAQFEKAIYDSSSLKFSQISTLPKDLKDVVISKLGDEILTLKVIKEAIGDQAHKILFETIDHKLIESVRLTYRLKNKVTGLSKIHHSLCISSQAGCALGCTFCATGKMGLQKNLTVDEIVDQYLYFRKHNLPIDSIIFMGMGEPFSNPINVLESLEIFTNPNKIGIGQRKISISTVGIIPGIEKLTQTYPQINLAFSLHSPFPDQRLQLMPITKAYSIDQVFRCLDERMKVNNHKIFIAYVLLAGVNDSVEHARALAQLIRANQHRQRLLHVNLIRYNPGNSKTVYQKPSKETVDLFKEILTESGVKNTLRQDFGVNIDAACGQLAAASRS